MAREWTDDRLDVLSEKVTFGFKLVDERFMQVDRRFEEIDKRFDQIDKRFEQIDKRFENVEGDIKGLRSEIATLQRTMTQGFIALTTAMLAGFGGLAALIAVQG